MVGQAASHKGLGMSESAKRQTKITLRKRIIRRIANGGTSPIVGQAYLERSSSPNAGQGKTLNSNRGVLTDKKQIMDYSLPGDPSMGIHLTHNDNLHHAMNVYIRRPFKNAKDQKKVNDAAKYITLKDGLSRPGNFINEDSIGKSLIKNKS